MPGARDQFAALLAVYEQALGPEHPETVATIRADLARFTGEAGDAAGARDQFAVLLRTSEQVLGPEHPNTLITRAPALPASPGRRETRPELAISSPSCFQ
jgi:hypothetical protein